MPGARCVLDRWKHPTCRLSCSDKSQRNVDSIDPSREPRGAALRRGDGALLEKRREGTRIDQTISMWAMQSLMTSLCAAVGTSIYLFFTTHLLRRPSARSALSVIAVSDAGRARRLRSQSNALLFSVPVPIPLPVLIRALNAIRHPYSHQPRVRARA